MLGAWPPGLRRAPAAAMRFLARNFTAASLMVCMPTLLVGPSGRSVRADVLIEAEEVGRVVSAFEGLESIVLGGPVGLLDPLFSFLHEEIDVHAGVVGSQRGPVVAGPLPFCLESLGGVAIAIDGEGEAGVPAVEGGFGVADAGDGSPHLP